MPRCAATAVARHFAQRDALACSDFMRWFDDADRLRARVAGFIHCQPADIALVQNASAVLSLLLGGMDWKTGDWIVTLEDEFPNHYYHPSNLRGNGVEFVETAFEQFYACLTPRTRLVAISTGKPFDGIPCADRRSLRRSCVAAAFYCIRMGRRAWARCRSTWRGSSSTFFPWMPANRCSRPTARVSCR